VFLSVWLVTVIPSPGNFTWKPYILLWFWLGVGADIIFGLPAWWQVFTRFRQMAVRRYGLAVPRAAG